MGSDVEFEFRSAQWVRVIRLEIVPQRAEWGGLPADTGISEPFRLAAVDNSSRMEPEQDNKATLQQSPKSVRSLGKRSRDPVRWLNGVVRLYSSVYRQPPAGDYSNMPSTSVFRLVLGPRPHGMNPHLSVRELVLIAKPLWDKCELVLYTL